MKEVWKDIRFTDKGITYDYRGLYQVSNFGRVKRIYKKGTEIILKPEIIKGGYLRISLYKDKKKKRILVHQIMALMFIPNPENKAQVNHKFGDKTQNIVDLDNLYGETTTLEWNTCKENVNHAWENGLCVAKKGKNHPQSKAVLQYDLQGNFIKRWDYIRQASQCTKIHEGSISECCRKKRKKAGNFIWRYANEGNECQPTTRAIS